MAQAAIALACSRGEDVTFPLTHQTSATDSTAVNITGWTISAKVRNERNDVIFTIAGTIVSGVAGTYTIAFTSAQLLIEPKSYKLDVWRTHSGSAKPMGVGTLTVTPNVRFAI